MTQTPGSDAQLIEGYYGIPQALASSRPSGGTTIEGLATAIARHADSEAGALAQYGQLAEQSGDPVIALVMNLILEDEERHHGLLKRIEASLRDALEWTRSPSALPSAMPAEAQKDLAQVAHKLVQEEQNGVRRMRELAESEKGISGGLHSLLLQMMAMDSEKHALMLRFVQARLEPSRRG